jgi:hypothetical protein
MTTSNKPSIGFWIIAIIALIWNAMGVMTYLMEQYKVESYRAEYNAEQLALIDSAPAWSTALFAIAVFGGLLGCLLLLMRKKLATPLFLISLLCILVNMGYALFGTNQIELFGTLNGLVMPLVVVVIGIFLYVYSKKMTAKGVLK